MRERHRSIDTTESRTGESPFAIGSRRITRRATARVLQCFECRPEDPAIPGDAMRAPSAHAATRVAVRSMSAIRFMAASAGKDSCEG